MDSPTIFIGSPCYGDVSPDILEDWMRFAFHCGRRMPQYEFKLGIKTKSEQFRARNSMVEQALKCGARWLLMLDDDMVINPLVTNGPTDDYGFLDRLIGHGKDVCGILYYQRTGTCSPVLMKRLEDGRYRFLEEDEITKGLQRVDVAGGGCLLINMRVFDRIAPPYFDAEHVYGTDIQLCRKVSDAGFEVWADTSIEFGHIRQERVIVTGRNRHQFISESLPGEMRKFVSTEMYDRLIKDAIEWTGYKDFEEITRNSDVHLRNRQEFTGSLPDWYRLYPTQRVARQVWFNVGNNNKRQITEYVLAAVPPQPRCRILDFGSGIGLTAFTLAERGHDVLAADIAGTGTLEFLKWRVNRHRVKLQTRDLSGDPSEMSDAGEFEAIVAMDVLEHIPEWKRTLSTLCSLIRPGGVLFCNNGILDDNEHPEHFPLDNREFISECMSNNLYPINQIAYIKRAARGSAAGG